METALDTLYSTLADQASALIRAEVRAGHQRELLERAVRDSLVKMGANINDVSDATGLTVDEIKSIMRKPRSYTLSELFGLPEGGSAMMTRVESSASS
jgi:hypothetical protein